MAQKLLASADQALLEAVTTFKLSFSGTAVDSDILEHLDRAIAGSAATLSNPGTLRGRAFECLVMAYKAERRGGLCEHSSEKPWRCFYKYIALLTSSLATCLFTAKQHVQIFSWLRTSLWWTTSWDFASPITHLTSTESMRPFFAFGSSELDLLVNPLVSLVCQPGSINSYTLQAAQAAVQALQSFMFSESLHTLLERCMFRLWRAFQSAVFEDQVRVDALALVGSFLRPLGNSRRDCVLLCAKEILFSGPLLKLGANKQTPVGMWEWDKTNVRMWDWKVGPNAWWGEVPPPPPTPKTADRQLERSEEHGSTTLWEFQCNNGSWVPYCEQACKLLEQTWHQLPSDPSAATSSGQPSASAASLFLSGDTEYTYSIDLQKMQQRNITTGRVRSIRRNLLQQRCCQQLEACPHKTELETLRSRLADLQEQLLAKDRAVKSSKIELISLGQRLKRQQMESDALIWQLLRSREVWKNELQKLDEVKCSLPNLVAGMQAVLAGLLPTGHTGKCQETLKVKVVEVYSVCNVDVWQKYKTQRDTIKRRLCNQSVIKSPEDSKLRANPRLHSLGALLLQGGSSHILQEACNEVLLLHGTSAESAQAIALQGFDGRLARESDLYGKGVYLTTDACKALSYSSKPPECATTGWFVVARALLGYPHFTETHRQGQNRPPFRALPNGQQELYDSIVAAPGIIYSKADFARQVHWEYVVSDWQAYPEYLVKYQRL
ncbi:unnamed protein product [Polarella glacialis]|uniref:Poly [ADP-ribose] polymerase n=1 Tax=Polarella glacialis TaxID=89957 RepID=A0A813JJP4_POLGL|nr:unnamed protein product [Polarella glacialis]